MKIVLDEEYIYDGAWYGPGEIDVKDENVAKALIASQDRIRNMRNPAPVIKPNAIKEGVVSKDAPPPQNGVTADDYRKQTEASEKIAADALKAEEDAKKAAKDAKK